MVCARSNLFVVVSKLLPMTTSIVCLFLVRNAACQPNGFLISDSLSWLKNNAECQCLGFNLDSILPHNTAVVLREISNPLDAVADLRDLIEADASFNVSKILNMSIPVEALALPLLAKPLLGAPLLMKPLLVKPLWSAPLVAKPALAVSLLAKPLLLKFVLKSLKLAIPLALLKKVKLSIAILGAALAAKILLLKGLFVALLIKGAILLKKKAVAVFAALKVAFLAPVLGALSTLSCLLQGSNCVFDFNVAKLGALFCVPPLVGQCPEFSGEVCASATDTRAAGDNFASGGFLANLARGLPSSFGNGLGLPLLSNEVNNLGFPNVLPLGVDLSNNGIIEVGQLFSAGNIFQRPWSVMQLDGQSAATQPERGDIPEIPELSEDLPSSVSDYLRELRDSVLSLEQGIVDVQTFQELVGDEIQPLASYMNIQENSVLQEILNISPEVLTDLDREDVLPSLASTVEEALQSMTEIFEPLKVV